MDITRTLIYLKDNIFLEHLLQSWSLDVEPEDELRTTGIRTLGARPDSPSWTTMVVILILLAVALAIYK